MSDMTRHCPLCEDFPRRAEQAEARAADAYAALEWLRGRSVGVYEFPDGLTTMDVRWNGPQPPIDFYRNLSFATGRTLEPPAAEPPTLSSLRGMAPGLTGGIDSVEFVRGLRDGPAAERECEKG